MHGICFEFDLQEWFEFDVPETSIPFDFIFEAVKEEKELKLKPHSKIIYLGGHISTEIFEKKKKKKTVRYLNMTFQSKKDTWDLQVTEDIGKWLKNILAQLKPDFNKPFTFKQLEENFNQNDLGDFDVFLRSKTWRLLKENEILIIN